MHMKMKMKSILGFCILFFVVSMFLGAEGEGESSEKIDKLFTMSLEDLMNVKISTAGKSPEKITDIPASVVLITREDIEIYGYRTLAEILQNIPGLYGIDDYSEDGINFGVRGFWSGVPNDNIVIMINGVPQGNDFQSNYPLNKVLVPVEAIDRIEVVRGPMSVIYGSGAFYGAINIITNTMSGNSHLNLATLSVGSDNTTKMFVRDGAISEDYYWAFNATLYNTNGLDKPLRDMVRDPFSLYNYGIDPGKSTAKTLEENHKYFNFTGGYKGFYFNFNYAENKREIYFLLPSVSDGTLARITAADVNFGYKKDISEKLSIDAKFTYSRNRVNTKYDFLFPGFYGVETVDSNAWEGEFILFYRPNPLLDITSGLYYRSVLGDSDTYDLPSFGDPSLENVTFKLADGQFIMTRALFSQLNFSPFEKLKLVAGVRFEQVPSYKIISQSVYQTDEPVTNEGVYDRERIETIPRLAIIYYLNKHNIFKFLYGAAINRPSFFQNTRNALDPVHNNLKPERIHTLEINYITTLTKGVTLNLSLFRNTLDNLITRIVRFNDEGQYESWSGNAGKMVTNGAEMAINIEPVDNLRIELSGSLQKTKDKRENYKNIPVAYSPNFLGYVRASYRIAPFTISLTGDYVDKMETYWDETILNPDSTYGNRIGEPVDSYFIFGCNVRFDNIFLLNGLYLNLKCSNLFNDTVRYPTYTNNSWADAGTLGIGRQFLLTMGYKF